MRRVLVAGATGETGRRVVAALRARGDAVRALARDAARARAVLGDDVEVHVGDVRDAASLVGAARDVAGAINCVGTRTYFGANGGAAVDALGAAHLAAALAADGVPHLVHLSAFGLDRRSVWLSAFSAALGDYFRHKAAAEAAVRASGAPWTIVRPVELRNRLPHGVPLLNQDAPWSLLRTVSRELVADVLVRCLGDAGAVGKTFELSEGPGPAFEAQLAAMREEASRPIPARTPLLGRAFCRGCGG